MKFTHLTSFVVNFLKNDLDVKFITYEVVKEVADILGIGAEIIEVDGKKMLKISTRDKLYKMPTNALNAIVSEWLRRGRSADELFEILSKNRHRLKVVEERVKYERLKEKFKDLALP